MLIFNFFQYFFIPVGVVDILMVNDFNSFHIRKSPTVFTLLKYWKNPVISDRIKKT